MTSRNTKLKTLRAITDEYLPGKEIGKGSYGTVHICSHNSNPAILNLCMKKIDLSKMKRKDLGDLIKEAKLLEMFDHPNIVKLVDYFATPDTLCIVQEYCSARDLAWEVKEMRKTKKFFHEDCIWSWFLQLCCSIKHIHDRKILHRDIKTANIFLHRHDNNSWPIVKLGDFGIGKALEHTDAFAKSTVGTPYYMSPEICDNKPYSYKSDVWSVGVVLYEITTLKQPFDSHNFNGLVLKILKGKYERLPSEYSGELRGIVKLLLTTDQAVRPDMTGVLKTDAVMSKILKSGIAVDVLQREFEHTHLHGFKPLDIINDSQPPKLPAVSENMAKVLGAFDDTHDDPEILDAMNPDRERKNIQDLQNGGGKFLLNGETLILPGITHMDTRDARMEALRKFLEQQLGPKTFLDVYNIMNAVSEGDDEAAVENQLRDRVGDRNMNFLCLVAQLIFCEERANEEQNASR